MNFEMDKYWRFFYIMTTSCTKNAKLARPGPVQQSVKITYQNVEDETRSESGRFIKTYATR